MAIAAGSASLQVCILQSAKLRQCGTQQKCPHLLLHETENDWRLRRQPEVEIVTVNRMSPVLGYPSSLLCEYY